MVRCPIALACAALGVLAAPPAGAACTFTVQPIPVTMVGPRPTVTVTIKGRPAHFLLDSGAAMNAISAELAADETAGISKWLIPTIPAVLMGAGGKRVYAARVIAPEIQFLGETFRDQMFTVSPRLGAVDGLLGQSMLRQMDVEYDLRGGVIRLVKTHSCKTTDMTYWVKEGQSYTKIPLTWLDRLDPHAAAEIVINGQKMQATFDTGSPITFITRAAAARAGVKVTDPGVIPIGKGGGIDSDFDAWAATFEDVRIGDEVIRNAPMEIGDTRTDRFDVLLGADFFLSHHVYVSQSQSRIYIAYEGGPAFRGPPVRPFRFQAVPPAAASASPAPAR